jgi:hypothetical protein
MWISVYFLCEQFGIVAGQGASTLFISLGEWKWSFLVETGLLLGPVVLLYLCVPGRYFQSSATQQDDETLEQRPVKAVAMSQITY